MFLQCPLLAICRTCLIITVKWVTVGDDGVTDVSIIAGHVDHWEMRFKKLCLKENRPSPASDAFSSALDKEESSSSSSLLDPCSPWSFVPIASSLKPSGARPSPLSVLFWEEQRNDLMIYSGSRNCSRSVANWISVRPSVGHPQLLVKLSVALGGF